ncbi:hypothetical protein HK098_006532 [Nowakowskiella sp. JEL0407]|nr:hypothetical protein HK098_006532 [Nowakowskiella sp. JEL0407]
MQSTWTPNETLASQLAEQLLLLATDVHDQSRQKAHLNNIEQFNTLPDSNNYYAYILACLDSGNQNLSFVREIAGTQLRNLVRKFFQVSDPTRDPAEYFSYTRLCGIHALRDSNQRIRETAGSVLAAFAASSVVDAQILQKLLETANDQNVAIAESAMRSISEFCEEGQIPLTDASNSHILQVLIPELFRQMDNPSSMIRLNAIRSINPFILSQPPALTSQIDVFIDKLGRFLNDTDPLVRKSICESLVMILDVAVEKMAPKMDLIVDYILKSMNDGDEDVMLEATEFWTVFADREENAPLLRPYLKHVVPVLLNKMVFSEDEISILEAEEESASKPDEDKDILFRGHKARNITNQNSEEGTDHPEDEEDDYDDDDGEEDFGEQMWTVRKCAAAALDSLASLFKDDLMADQSIFLAPLSAKLGSSDWKERECGILALGAVADGCKISMAMHLGSLIPFLVQSLGEQNERLVKVIGCWTLGRYSWWLSRPAVPRTDPTYQVMREKHHLEYLQPVLNGFLKLMLDNSKSIQKAGCSAFATLESEAKTELVPYLPVIIQTIVLAFEKYQRKNTLLLYDVAGTLAEVVKGHLATSEGLDALMTALRRKWETTKDDDLDIVYLIECFATISRSVQNAFAAYLPAIWGRCLKIIERTILQFEADPTLSSESEEKDAMIVALDFLSGVVGDLPQVSAHLVNENTEMFFQLLYRSMKDEKLEVRQSAFALLGDLASQLYEQLRPHLQVLLPIAISELESYEEAATFQMKSVINNAAWAIGEVAIKMGSDLALYSETILSRLVNIMIQTPREPRREDLALNENAAIAVGRLGSSNPEIPAKHLSEFFVKWCEAASKLPDDWEKISTYKGICAMIFSNPEAIVSQFAYFCHAVASWKDDTVPPELDQMFRSLLFEYKQMFAQQNKQIQIPDNVKEVLSRRYGF